MLQAVAFCAIAHNSFAKPVKVKKTTADITVEQLAELDIENETEPKYKGFILKNTSHTKTLVRIESFAYTSTNNALV